MGMPPDNIDPEEDITVEVAWRQEVAARVEALKTRTVEMIPWDEIRDGLLAKLSQRSPS